MRQQLLVPAIVAGTLILGAWGLNRAINPELDSASAPSDQIPGKSAPVPQDKKQAPDFELEDVLTGKKIRLLDYRGKVVLIDFWATWCRPCRMEIPHFVDLKNEYASDGFEIIGISVDRKGKGVVVPFVKEWKINYPIVIDSGGSVSIGYGGIRSIPTAFLIGRQGEVLNRFVGYRPKGVFEQAIKQALKG